MYNSADIAPILFCLLIALLAVELPAVKRALLSFAPGRISRLVVALLIGFSAHFAATKPPMPTGNVVAQFVTALFTGRIVDASGMVAASTQAETVAAFADLSIAIVAAASQTVVNAQSDIDDVAWLITNNTRKVVYLQCSLPRTDPAQGITNHNISAVVVRTRQRADGAAISRYVWYSQVPAVAPSVAAVVDVGGGPIHLTAITNTFPDTIDIGGIPCIRYDYALPQGLRSVVLFPDTELALGSRESYLLVPAGGILVNDGTDHLGYTGTDRYFTNRVQVDHRGGIATALYIDGSAVTNGVYAL